MLSEAGQDQVVTLSELLFILRSNRELADAFQLYYEKKILSINLQTLLSKSVWVITQLEKEMES